MAVDVVEVVVVVSAAAVVAGSPQDDDHDVPQHHRHPDGPHPEDLPDPQH